MNSISVQDLYNVYRPAHKSLVLTCTCFTSASTKVSDEPAHMRSLPKAFTACIKYGSRGRLRPNICPLAMLNISAWSFKGGFCANATDTKSGVLAHMLIY